MDIYLPADRYYHTPVIIFMHGGGWVQGSKSEFSTYCSDYQAKGYACVTMNYRFTDDDGATYVEIMDDIHSVITYMADRSGDWRISDHFALAGFSAGAVNAVLYPYGFDDENYVSACVAFSGAYDMNDPVTRAALLSGMGQDIILLFAGTEENFNDASPIYHLKNVPSLIFHGENDGYMDAVTHVGPFVQALEDNGITHNYTLYTSTGHSAYFNSVHKADVTAKMDDWFEDYLW
jgi:acetyl esterase/lipase